MSFPELAEPGKQPEDWVMPGLKPKSPSVPSTTDVAAVVASDNVTADVAKARLIEAQRLEHDNAVEEWKGAPCIIRFFMACIIVLNCTCEGLIHKEWAVCAFELSLHLFMLATSIMLATSSGSSSRGCACTSAHLYSECCTCTRNYAQGTCTRNYAQRSVVLNVTGRMDGLVKRTDRWWHGEEEFQDDNHANHKPREVGITYRTGAALLLCLN